PPVEPVEDRGDEDRDAGGFGPPLRGGDDREEPGEQAARGEQVGQQVDAAAAARLGRRVVHPASVPAAGPPAAGAAPVTERPGRACAGPARVLQSGAVVPHLLCWQEFRMHRSILGAALALAFAPALAQQTASEVYQWKDANGVTHFSQTPPAG